MLDVANHVARTQNVSPAAEVELKADLAPVAAEVAGDLHDLRRQHAERFTQQMLGLANTDPVATIEQNVAAPNGEASLTTDLARGLNAQATANAQMTATQMRALGFTEEAIQRTNELVRHHSVAGESATEVRQQEAATEPSDALALDPQAQPQDLSEQEQLAEREPQPLAQTVGESQDLGRYMAELEEAVAQDQTIPEPDRVQEPLDDQIADPLANSALMVEVEINEPVAMSQSGTQQTALETNAAQLTAERADKLATGIEVAEAPSLSNELAEPETRVEPRFDYRPTAAKTLDLEGEALSLAPEARKQEERDEKAPFSFVNPLQQQQAAVQAQAVERTTEGAREPFKVVRDSELEYGRTERDGRARVTAFRAAA